MRYREDLGTSGNCSEVVTLKSIPKVCWRNHPGRQWREGKGVAETSAGSKALNQERAAVKVPKESWCIRRIVRSLGPDPTGSSGGGIQEFVHWPPSNGKPLMGFTQDGYDLIWFFQLY